MLEQQAAAPKRSRANTRDRLLAAAYEVFTETGYYAATVEDVCAAAGFTRGAFYSNFSSKEELFLALWAQRTDVMLDIFEPALTVASNSEHPFDTIVLLLSRVDLFDRRWFMLNTEFLLHALRNPAIAEGLAQQRSRLRDALRPHVEQLIAAETRKLPSGIDADSFVRMLIAAYEGCAHQSLIEPGGAAADRLRGPMFALLFDACVSEDGESD